MPNLETLRKQAEEKGLEVAEGATKAEVQAMLDEVEKAEKSGDHESTPTDETPADKAVEDIKTPSLPETEVTPTTAPAEPKADETPAAVASQDLSAAAAIGEAIAKGLSDAKEEKKMVISTDESVVPRFSIVRDTTTGEYLTRENETGVISQLQLKSLEEKQADLQSRDVEEV